jgi:hypothetical protein
VISPPIPLLALVTAMILPLIPASLRADAAGNRAWIIWADRAAIANADEMKLNAIARQAGVGQGTLYRHFPTREDLLWIVLDGLRQQGN